MACDYMSSLSLKSIAAHFNISIAAVSNALNGLPGVSDELRERIIEYANENRYIPNMFGRGLKGIKCKTIGVIMPDNANPYYSMQIKGIEQESRKHDYSLILCNSSDELRLEEKYIDVLLQRNVDGFLIIPAPQSEKNVNRYKMLEQKKLPFIMMNRSIPGYVCDTVKPDYKTDFSVATEYLIKKGHEKILLVAPKHIYSTQERLDGFKTAHSHMAVPFKNDSIYYCDKISFLSGYKVMREILDDGRRDFTAVFAFDDYIAFGIMKAILERGLRIPEDIALMGYDDVEFCDICAVPLTTMRQDSFLLGELSFNALLQRINGSNNETEVIRDILPPAEIVERKSV